MKTSTFSQILSAQHLILKSIRNRNASLHFIKQGFYSFIVLTVLSFVFLENANAQTADWLWAKQMSGGYYGYGKALAVDASGNVYSTGVFSGTVDFDPDNTNYNLTTPGADDAYISKLNSSGSFVWAKSISGTGGQGGYALALDASNNVYTAGVYNGSTDFDPGPGFNVLPSTGSRDIYISKLSSDGNFIWAKTINGTGNTGNHGLYSIAIDPSNGDVYIAGWLNGTSDFDPGAGVYNLTSNGGSDVFLCKLNSSGDFLWAKSWGNTFDDGTFFVTLDNSGNVYVPGGFQGTVDFDPGPGTFNLTSVDTIDIFISKFDKSGNFLWAKTIGGTGFEYIHSLFIDPSSNGDIYAAGNFNGTVDFDPGAGTFNLTSNGDWDIFVMKLNGSGNFDWVKAIGGPDYDEINSLVMENSGGGGIYITGVFNGTVDFNPGSGTANLTSAGGNDIYVCKLDKSGNYQWACSVGGTGDDSGNHLALDASGNIHVTGNFDSPSLTIGSTTFTNTIGSPDIFVAKIDRLTGISTPEIFSGISVYPNPAIDQLVISYPISSGKDITVTITDISGKIIFKTNSTNTEKTIVNIKDFAEGVYQVKVQTGDIKETRNIMVVK